MGVKMNIVYAAIILIGILCIANIYTITTYSAVFNEAIQVTDYKTALQMDMIWGSKQKLPDAPSWFDTLATNPGAIIVISLLFGGGLIIMKKLVHKAANGKTGPVTNAIDKVSNKLSSPTSKAINSATSDEQRDPKKAAETINQIEKIEKTGNSSVQAKLRSLSDTDILTSGRHVKSQNAPKSMLETISDFLKGTNSEDNDDNKGGVELTEFE